MSLVVSIRDVLRATPRASVVRLDLGGATLDYVAGQAVMVGDHGQPVRRPYSMASSPEDAARDGWIELLIGVDEQGRAGHHLTLSKGARLDLDGPVGSFTFPEQPQESRFVFIAGGTGIAPLRAMLRHALTRPHREVGLYYSARTPDEFAYEEELRGLAREGRIELTQTVTRTTGGDWNGERGRLGHAHLRPLVHGRATLCFICGPPGLVAGLSTILQELGVPTDRIRVEAWHSPSADRARS